MAEVRCRFGSPLASLSVPSVPCPRLHQFRPGFNHCPQALQQQLDAAGDNVQALKAVVTAAGCSDAGALNGLFA